MIIILSIEDFYKIFQYGDGDNSGEIMFERFVKVFKCDTEKFEAHLCSIDRAKWNKYIYQQKKAEL